MRLVIDPAISTKIARMKERVRWQHPLMRKHGIDQTRLELPATEQPSQEFSFLVLGDSGTSRHAKDRPQRRIAKLLLKHAPECEFVLHTGDVVYLVGSSEQYPDNFIKPYREFLVGGDTPHKIRYDKITFKQPFLPVLGNHDYYDLPLIAGILSKALSPLRHLLRRRINLDVGWHGSHQGEGFAKAFMDYTHQLSPRQLEQHLQQHYTATSDTGRCLRYLPGTFTRLPNRYYTFRKAGIDFFALDSYTFNSTQPLPKTEEGKALRERMEKERELLDAKMRAMFAESLNLSTEHPEEAERASYLYSKMEQIEEQLADIDKQLTVRAQDTTLDTEQLDWLRDRLIASWQDPTAKGRVLYFHHPPYVTEASKWFQGQTLAVRTHLRAVLDQVQSAIGEYSKPLESLVLSGHAHCFEYLKTVETGHGDRIIPWVVCGGSGFSLRRQRKEGDVLEEYGQPVAKSHLFLGRSGHGSQKRRPYSALRVDVTYKGDDTAPTFVLRPLISERVKGAWNAYEASTIVLK